MTCILAHGIKVCWSSTSIHYNPLFYPVPPWLHVPLWFKLTGGLV